MSPKTGAAPSAKLGAKGSVEALLVSVVTTLPLDMRRMATQFVFDALT
jgi:hypothetical protein